MFVGKNQRADPADETIENDTKKIVQKEKWKKMFNRCHQKKIDKLVSERLWTNFAWIKWLDIDGHELGLKILREKIRNYHLI